MLKAPIPLNEEERIAELRALRILDTPPEERFDRLVQLAAHLFGVPIAYIAMVDSDRQWFKSKCGLTDDQTGRDISFCGHAILNKEPLVINDATKDERFADNPLVVGEPHVRLYVGCPLRGPNGHNVGTICIVDNKPREINDSDIETLKRLGAMAERELDLLDLVGTQQRLIKAQRLALTAQERLAGELAARMFRKAPDTLTPQEIGDALGELTNMISGNLKPLLPGWGRISLPSTAPGTGRGLLPPESREILRIGARCLGEDMVVVFHSSTDHN